MIQFAPLAAIHIQENRQRAQFDADAHEELKESIRQLGLFHAPVVRSLDGALTLVAGERRLRAMTDLQTLGIPFTYNSQPVPEGFIPYVNLGDLSPLEAEEAELEENIRRRDLTPQEHASAIKRIHDLRVAQAATRGESHSVAQTALEVTGHSEGYYQDSVRNAIAVAENLHIPGVAKAKSMNEAVKILKAEDRRQRNIALAASVGETFTASAHTAVFADSEQWCKTQEHGQFDVILTDPPYGMGADQFGDGGGKLTTADHTYEDSYEYWQKFMSWFPQAIFRLAKPEAHAYVFCDIDRFHEFSDLMALAGWYVFRTPFIVHKTGGGRVPLPDRGPRRCWEMCLYAIKGSKPVTHIYPDVIPCEADTNMGFGAQKPVALYQNLLQRSCLPGDRVLDLCAGTGPIFPAAHALRVTAVGVEQDQSRYGLCLQRIQQIKAADTGLGEALL